MVRPHFGPSRFKPRSHSDGYNNNMPPQEHQGPQSRNQRGFRGPRGKAPPSWRENRGVGRPHLAKRPPLMGERREQPTNQWRSPNQDSFHAYPSHMEPHHGHRRPSPSRPNRPPPPQRRSPPPQSPAQASPGQRGTPHHAHHSSHHSPSPRRYHGQPPPDRRPAPAQPHPRGSFRGLGRRPCPSREEERNWGPRRHHSLREAAAAPRGGRRWNGRGGGFSHPHGGERAPSGFPQRRPREFHGRGPYAERWSAERDSRKQQYGEVGREREREREGSGHRGGEWPQEGGSPHHPPYRSPSWKGGQPQSSSFYHNSSPQERPGGPPPPQRKRTFQQHHGGAPPPGPGPEERGHPKSPRTDAPHVCNNAPRGFGGRPLSLKDKSRILKGRKMRVESTVTTRIRAPPPPPRPGAAEIKTAPKPQLLQEDGPHRSTLAMRKERFQDNADPLRRGPNKQAPRLSPPNADDNTSRSSKDSESAREQVESPRALRARSSSPLERLSRDLVVVSQWQAPHSSSDDRSSSRERTSKTKTERYNSDGHLMLNERFSKMHDSSTSPKDQRGRYSDLKNQRPADLPGRPFRKPAPPQRPGFRPGPRRTFPEPAGPFRKPLMGTFVPRPFPSQKPGFRKSQSIMSKYRNMQSLRQRVPYQRPSNQRRW